MPPDREDNLSTDIRALVQAIGDQTRATGALTQSIASLAQAIGATHLDHEARLRKLEEIAITLKERMSIWQLAQVGYTTLASAIAGAISFIRR